MSNDEQVFLDGAEYAAGDLRPIEEVPEMSDRPQLLDYFRRTGLRTYSRSEQDSYELARRSAEQTLEATGIDRAQIDMVLLSSLTFQNSDEYRVGSAKLLHDLRLPNAYPIGIHLSACGNIHVSIHLAMQLIGMGRSTGALVITTDVTPAAKSRLVAPDVSIYSDAAASFVLARNEKFRYRVLGAANHINTGMWKLDPKKDLLVMLRDTKKGMRRVLEEVLVKAGKTARDMDYVLPINSNEDVIGTVFEIVEIPRERIHTELSRFAHSYASDNTINLAELTAREKMRPGAALLMLGSNYYMWGATVLERT